MKKQIPALIAAILVTACVAFAMLGVGLNALLNKNGVAASNSNVNAVQVSASTSADQAQIAQLQSRIQEYQQRETQYQHLLQDAQTQLQQDAQQEQQFQAFIQALESRGILRVRSDGSIVLVGQ